METQELTLVTESVEDTRALGARIAEWLAPGDVVALFGDLGAGKTACSQGIARGLGITATVTSPTFTLINQYRLACGWLHHVDCYRLTEAPLEMWDVGLVELMAGDDIVLIEWADRLASLLPEKHLAITFSYLDETRRLVSLRGCGTRFREMAGVLAQDKRAPASDAARVAKRTAKP